MATTTKPIDKEYLLQTLKDFDAKILKNSYIEKYDAYAKMPAASSTTVGKIIQYIGVNDTTNHLTNGYFYIVVEDSSTTPSTYKWVEKAVMEIPAGVEYSIVKESTPDTGYFATYQLYGATAGGSPAPITGSAKINIPKDFLVKSGTVSTVTAADKAAGGKFEDDPNFQVGDKYIDFVVNVKEGTATDEHLYINVKDLVDVYTGGDGITVNGSNAISVDVASSGGLELTGTSPNKQVGIKIDSTSSNQIALHVGAGGLYGSLLLADPDDPDEAIDFDTEW